MTAFKNRRVENNGSVSAAGSAFLSIRDIGLLVTHLISKLPVTPPASFEHSPEHWNFHVGVVMNRDRVLPLTGSDSTSLRIVSAFPSMRSAAPTAKYPAGHHQSLLPGIDPWPKPGEGPPASDLRWQPFSAF